MRLLTGSDPYPGTIEPMTDRSRPVQGAEERWYRAWLPIAVWAIGFAVLVAYVLQRLDLFPLTTTVVVDGDETTLARAFFTVDHPFHTARAELIREALASFDTVRWVGSHQGGYPAEFFPFGLPAVVALLALLSAGTIAVESAWAITIALMLLLPGLAYLLIGREDRLSPAVALIALAGQVAIASDWTHGGFTELVEWGLATNVAGATFALVSIPLLVRAADRRSGRSVAMAASVIALCALSNPRSLIAVTVVAVALVVHAGMVGGWREGVVVVSLVGALSLGLAAPVVMPLLRYSDHYFFLSYQEYDGISAYLEATVDAVTWPLLILALAGAAVSFLRPAHRTTQVMVIAVGVYMALTMVAAAIPAVRDVIPQLELPRLMPFQRLAIIWLAAYAVVEVVRWALAVPARVGLLRDIVLAGAVSVLVLAVFATDAGPIEPHERGLREVPRTEGADGVELVEFRTAIALADELAPAETAILVIGTRLSWHEQLWAPMAAEDRRFFYDNWLWYWHRQHDGPYDYRVGHHYPNPSEALSAEYSSTHAIGAVVITDIADQATGANARDVARRSVDLDLAVTVGSWDVFAVSEPTTIATLNGAAADTVEVSDDLESITVSFTGADPGTVLVRQNWFPRWEAEVNGEPVGVARAENGYLAVATQGGDIELRLSYGVTSTDVVARLASGTSVLVVLVLLIVPGPTARSARRLWSAGRARVPR